MHTAENTQKEKESATRHMKVVTPIPLATFNQMRKEGGTPPPRDVTSVEIIPNK